jgi:hypothetical protein
MGTRRRRQTHARDTERERGQKRRRGGMGSSESHALILFITVDQV